MTSTNKITITEKTLLLIYWLFFLSDLLTTYIATPDLAMEGNIWFRMLDVNWWQLIAIYSGSVIFVTIGTLFSLKYLYSYYSDSMSSKGSGVVKELISNKKLFFSFIFLGMFYSHVMNVGLVVLSNILILIYLQEPGGVFGEIASWYVHRQGIFRIFYQSAPILAGYMIAYYRIYYLFSINRSDKLHLSQT